MDMSDLSTSFGTAALNMARLTPKVSIRTVVYSWAADWIIARPEGLSVEAAIDNMHTFLQTHGCEDALGEHSELTLHIKAVEARRLAGEATQ